MANGYAGSIGWFTRTIGIRFIRSDSSQWDRQPAERLALPGTRCWGYQVASLWRLNGGRSQTGVTYLVVPAPLGQALILPSRSRRDRRHPMELPAAVPDLAKRPD